tara:strand:+ start:701 stop:1210 length:510 start_codon:yes stop_codon:yes gene_type:complete
MYRRKRVLLIGLLIVICLCAAIVTYTRISNKPKVFLVNKTVKSFSELPVDLGPEFNSLPQVSSITYSGYQAKGAVPTGFVLEFVDNINEEYFVKMADALDAGLIEGTNDLGDRTLRFSGSTLSGHDIDGGWWGESQRCILQVTTKEIKDIMKYNDMGGAGIDPIPVESK